MGKSIYDHIWVKYPNSTNKTICKVCRTTRVKVMLFGNPVYIYNKGGKKLRGEPRCFKTP